MTCASFVLSATSMWRPCTQAGEGDDNVDEAFVEDPVAADGDDDAPY